MPEKKPNLDSVTSINRDGSHHVLHPADVVGKYTFWRRVVGVAILVIYAVLPWIKVGGQPAVFLDTAHRRFHLMGITIGVQDLWILFFLISGLGFTLFFVTSLLGRIWCGWTCPYTVFLDHVFRRIERWIDGDAPRRKLLDAAPLSAGKISKRILKHSLFLLCSTLIAHVFISYFVSIEQLYQYLQTNPDEHLLSFGVVTFLTFVLYFCFAWFREQFCIVVCPYGRIQSALSDDNTMVIGYDAVRGEPRGKAKGKAQDAGVGDCIDCKRCINVCPTGIDIREGLQMECIGCAACIDACDDIMAKLDRKAGLIRYDSDNGLKQKPRRILRPRIFAYCALMLLGATTFGFTVYKKARPFHAQANKVRGIPFQKDATGVRNIYEIHLFNKRSEPDTFNITLLNAPDWVKTSGTIEDILLAPLEEKTYNLVVIAPAKNYDGSFDFTIQVQSNQDQSTIKIPVNFQGPNPQLYRNSLRP